MPSWTPVAPAPITTIVGGTERRVQASLCVEVSSKPGTGNPRGAPPVQMISFSASSRGPCSLTIVCGSSKLAMPAFS